MNMDLDAQLEDIREIYDLRQSNAVCEAVEYVLDDKRLTETERIKLAMAVLEEHWDLIG